MKQWISLRMYAICNNFHFDQPVEPVEGNFCFSFFELGTTLASSKGFQAPDILSKFGRIAGYAPVSDEVSVRTSDGPL